MKVPPKRKGNNRHGDHERATRRALNESPSEKEGKFSFLLLYFNFYYPSMKVPPKRKGNALSVLATLAGIAVPQ